jgi:UDP-N-acetylmuramoyl-L-alanyl-D-glutamate--2,6-diaminopimelate ligase
MMLCDIIQDMELLEKRGDFSIEIQQVRYQSSDVQPGDLFCTWQGENSDGHDYIDDAVKRGARALITEKNYEGSSEVAWARVVSGRKALAQASSNYFGRPSSRLRMVGITGTNGKTSTATLIHYILECAGLKSGLLGTVEYRIGEKKIAASRTTPESWDCQKMLAEMVKENCVATVMEVSSHALALDRVEGITFAVGVFTNLTQDHLDFHKTMEAYFLAKQKLFLGLKAGAVAVVNVDDVHGQRLLESMPQNVRTLTYTKSVSPSKADIQAEDIHYTAEGTSFNCRTAEGVFNVQVPWLGEFNVSNILAALATAKTFGITNEQLALWLPQAPPVLGRLQRIEHGGEYQVLVDYAHTDDAVKNILTSLRPLCNNRLKIVIGCGGDRDSGKRPLMAQAACEYADEVIFTSDNPRSEDPEAILQQMIKGVSHQKNFKVIISREEAIQNCIKSGQAGDIIVLAGKGHESTQETKEGKFPFSDYNVALRYLTEKSV